MKTCETCKRAILPIWEKERKVLCIVAQDGIDKNSTFAEKCSLYRPRDES